MVDKNTKSTSTIYFYDTHAKEYSELSKKVDMTSVYSEFEKFLLPKGKILDAGCGSGRDSAYFSKRGYIVTAIDVSSEICKIAEKIPEITVINKDIADIQYNKEFDGVWACASLLHVPKTNISSAVFRLIDSLKNGGVLYASWKYGNRERYDKDGRFYSDYNKKTIIELFSNYDDIEILKCWITIDALNRKDHKWINILVRKM